MSLARLKDATHGEDASLHAFCELLGARTGLQVRDKDSQHVSQVFGRRCHELKLGASQYLQLLRSQNDNSGEWRRLLPLLTNGESYFERDKGQFDLLKTKILPELIESRRKLGECTLRLWSAGCSTGEEAYSLAMIVDSVLPPGWNATILGTDINTEALEKGRRGIYGSWSFRGVESSTVNAYFRPVAAGQQITASMRPKVKFEYCNLSAPDWPDAKRGIGDMDLIMCRNVLIYFRRAVVSDVLTRFVRTLRPGGFLMTGHAELHDQNVAPLRTRLFVESAVYQRSEELGTSVHETRSALPAKQTDLSKLTPSVPLSLLPMRPSAPMPIRQWGTNQVNVDTSTPKVKTAQSWCEEAHQQANSGKYEQAVHCCRMAVEADSSYAEAYLVWAHICEERGQRNEAKNLLRKVIYLAPTNVDAYLALASLYEREGDGGRTRQMRSTALETLRAHSARTQEQTNLMQHLETKLSENNPQSATESRRFRQ